MSNKQFLHRLFLQSVAGSTGGVILPGSLQLLNDQSETAPKNKHCVISNSERIAVIGFGLYGSYAVDVFNNTALTEAFTFIPDESFETSMVERQRPVICIMGFDYFQAKQIPARIQQLRENGIIPIYLLIDHEQISPDNKNQFQKQLEQLYAHSEAFYKCRSSLKHVADFLSIIERSMNPDSSIIYLDTAAIAEFFQNAGEISIGEGMGSGEKAIENAVSKAIQMSLTGDLQVPRKILVLFSVEKEIQLHLISDALDIIIRETADNEDILCAVMENLSCQNKAIATVVAGDFQKG